MARSASTTRFSGFRSRGHRRGSVMTLSRMFIFALTLIIAGPAMAYSASAQVVALGASNTEGHGVGSSEAYPAQLERMLQAKGSSMHVSNAGVYGDTTGG